MIFVCLGTKRFNFNRLLVEIDRLCDEQIIKEDVVAQIGKTNFHPTNKKIKCIEFLNSNDYEEMLSKATMVITHGGTGAIVKALKMNKQVIAVPRREKYGEHSDDHQLQIVSFFEKNKFILSVNEISDLKLMIEKLRKKPLKYNFNSNSKIEKIIDTFISTGEK